MRNISVKLLMMILLSSFLLSKSKVYAQTLLENPELDKQITNFFKDHPEQRQNMNVPESDGRLLYEIIIKNNYKQALEIGTSTGYSSIWIAWALSKTGGKLISFEIDESRHNKAIEYFKSAGVEKYIDARLGDAHQLVPKQDGPFDFVFSDADKGWYKNYFIAVDPKLKVGGCYTTHNISGSRGNGRNSDYLEYLQKLSNYDTTVNEDGGGIAISYKKSQ